MNAIRMLAVYSLALFAGGVQAVDLSGNVTFGVGCKSEFYLAQNERAVVLGVSGLKKGNFCAKDYFGATCFVADCLSETR